ncbi:UDP-glucuronosyltransferase 2A1 isoform X2 [Esox lucius]|uniref:UDP-glucuronosyltransferase 2A1 isoform X2 n=1 Tax=Esox lucius TaxID=8010 RepID=UPI000661E6EA|nr:UDP-glucuronosyltransferase 2A1 isoform X2 [Esox lucius]
MVSVRRPLLYGALLLLYLYPLTQGGNVLVFPGEHSHWLNMRTILDELVDRNHNVTVLVCTASPSIDYSRSERYHFHVYDVPFDRQHLKSVNDRFIEFWMYDAQNASVLQIGLEIRDLMQKMNVIQLSVCDAILRDQALMESLRRVKFDVLLADPMLMCSDLLADVLDLPLVLSIRFSFGLVLERQCGQMPAPSSYVPSPPLAYTDQMSFFERVQNFAMYFFNDVLMYVHCLTTVNSYYSEIKGTPTTFCEIMGKADIWLIRTYWDFEYPRPFLPNFKFVGGLHCKPAKPLPAAMEEFVQSSGDDGIVVFSLGSMVKNLTKERGNTIASALGQIPQKVLWRYAGVKPETLAPNTRLYDWIPQNDLLGHPKTKAFITHGGTNGLYEAIYHGVPMVGVPLFADQPDNIMHMKTKGAAVMLDFNKMTSQDLVDGLNSVINDPTYKENMMRLSRIHHDQPMKPLDTAVFWIEFVMRNKGAKHLRVESHNLSWYQYHCLDVAAALLSVVGLITVVTVKTCTFFLRKCFRKAKARQKTE